MVAQSAPSRKNRGYLSNCARATLEFNFPSGDLHAGLTAAGAGIKPSVSRVSLALARLHARD
jgi:hypothetical protein